MSRFILVIVLLMHALAIADPAFLSSRELISEIEITHSHLHVHIDDHHHDHEEFNLDLKDIQSTLPSDEHAHRQYIIVSYHSPYILTDLQIHFFEPMNLTVYQNCHQKLPQSPLRQGIFRPPIFV